MITWNKSFNKISEIYKSNKSLPCRQAGVIQIIYDIVKAHGGELKVQTREGGGAEFIIQLPG